MVDFGAERLCRFAALIRALMRATRPPRGRVSAASPFRSAERLVSAHVDILTVQAAKVGCADPADRNHQRPTRHAGSRGQPRHVPDAR